MNLSDVTEMMDTGQKIPKDVLEWAEQRCIEQMADYKEHDLIAWIKPIEKKLIRIQNYKPFKLKTGPRPLTEIQKSIDYCVYMKKLHQDAHKPAEAAKWGYKLREYNREYSAALLKKVYVPEIEGNERRF